MEPVISLAHVDHFYGSGSLRRQILYDITADVSPGEIVILTGPSGSGKTTVLTLIGGLRTVTHGSVRTMGHELAAANVSTVVRVRNRIGFIFQAHNLLNSLTVRQNVQTALALDGSVSVQDAERRSDEMLAAVGLAQHIGKLPRQLSGGQKQRVAIARALVRRPQIVLADEPTAALDKRSGREVVDLLHGLAKRQACAIVLVTHDNRILDVADRILTLEDGRLTSYTSGLIANSGQMLSAFSSLHRKGELQSQLAQLSPQQFAEVVEKTTGECEQLLRSLDSSQQEASEAVLDQVLEAITLKVADLAGAERASIFLVDADRSTLRSRIAQNPGAPSLQISLPIDRGIAGRVATTGEPLNVADAASHPDFYPEIDQETGFRTRNILAVPVRDRRNRVVGVAELLNKRNGPRFTAEDEQSFRAFAGSLGVLLEGCQRLVRR